MKDRDPPDPAPTSGPRPALTPARPALLLLDFGESDYLRLPNCGSDHYSLPDAGLLLAIDQWSAGALPRLTGEEGECDEYSPEVRAALVPHAAKFFEALAKSVEAGHLEAVILARTLPNSAAVPERTFVAFSDLLDWYETHGHKQGDYLVRVMEDRADELLVRALETARERAEFRHPDAHKEYEPGPDRSHELRYQRERVHELELQVALLQKSRSAAAKEERASSQKRRERTDLTIIAALCKRLKITPNERGSAARVVQLVADLGDFSIDDQTALARLRAIADALEAKGG